jgi:hypothetical protein
MSTGKSLTFYGLFDEVDTIEIPILQRDYAQGREDESEVRTLFLSSLFKALMCAEEEHRLPLDLDFVYGNFEGDDNKAFSVLDGQQRLTTLFLLHWYLALENNQLNDFRVRFVKQDGRSRFTYKTRPSTTEFFNALTVKDFNLSNRLISEQISDSQWFYSSWEQDPTVQACLCMLDAIQQMFSTNAKGLYEKLTNTSEPFITFQFLDLQSFGLSDELYIKMNARGKPLTIFENFKAKFEQIIQSFEGPWPSYKLDFKEGNVDGYHYFIHKIDTAWADLFWPYRNECSDENTFDDELMNFFRLIIAYQYILDNKELPINISTTGSDIFGKNGRLQPLTLTNYNELNCFNKELIKRLINAFDLIYNNGLVDNKIRPYLTERHYYLEESTFKNVLANTASYDDKIRFFAFYTYLSKSPEPQELIEWMRVIYNLTENTIINTSGDFCNALITVDQLCHFDTPILLTLKNNCEITGFTGAQVLEEKIKAHLLLKYQDWRVAIIGAEQHTFLNGQIGCILNFAGILAFYRKYGNCEWDEEQDQQFLANFIKYANLIGAVFDLIGKSSSAINFLWERAVLSKGVYFTEKKSGDRFNLLSSRDARNNIPRDHSWRRLLRVGSSEIEQKQAYVKDVLDDLNFESGDITTSLEKICNSALKKTDIESCWQVLIEHKELIRYCNQGFIEKNSHEFILLNESQRNHYHSELYTKALEIVLSKDKSLLAPFSCIDYHPVKSRDEKAFLEISGCFFDLHSYSLEVRKNKSTFEIKFKGGKPSNYSDALKSILTHLNFELVEIDFEGIDGLEGLKIDCDFANNKLNKLGDVINKVSNLCSDLRDLSNE